MGMQNTDVELDAEKWAKAQWGGCALGDARRVRRAVEMGRRMAEQPDVGLPQQMGGRSALVGAYRLLNNRRVTMAKLLQPHLTTTLSMATEARRQGQTVLMIHDGSVLDFSAHPDTVGLGSVGSRRQRGMILHSVLAVSVVAESVGSKREAQVLGLAHVQVIVRPEGKSPHNGGRRSAGPEGQVWENGVATVGRAPLDIPIAGAGAGAGAGAWVHVSDRESDVFECMASCLAHNTHFIVRARWNRRLHANASADADADADVAELQLLAEVRALRPDPNAPSFTVEVDATSKSSKRTARVVMSWCTLTLQAPQHVKGAARQPLTVNVVRAWEPDPPAEAQSVEWVLLTSLPLTHADQTRQITRFYECRWLIEDFHMCLKTGSRYEHSQLDHAMDLQTLLGFAAPIAVRLLQLRQAARHTPDVPAVTAVDPLLVRLLIAHFKFTVTAEALTVVEFWLAVARLGGYVGQPTKHPPGWRTVWQGWRTLSSWAEGARLRLLLS